MSEDNGFKRLREYPHAAEIVRIMPAMFAANARARRNALGWSQAFVCAELKTRFDIQWHQTVLAKVEGQEREVKLQEAYALASLYGMNLDDLLAGRGLESVSGD